MTNDPRVSSCLVDWKLLESDGPRVQGTMQWALETHKISGSIDTVIVRDAPPWIHKLQSGSTLSVDAVGQHGKRWLLLVEATVLEMEETLLVHLGIDSVCPEQAQPLVETGAPLESFATPCLAMTDKEQRGILETAQRVDPFQGRASACVRSRDFSRSNGVPRTRSDVDAHLPRAKATDRHHGLVILVAICLLVWMRVARPPLKSNRSWALQR